MSNTCHIPKNVETKSWPVLSYVTNPLNSIVKSVLPEIFKHNEFLKIYMLTFMGKDTVGGSRPWEPHQGAVFSNIISKTPPSPFRPHAYFVFRFANAIRLFCLCWHFGAPHAPAEGPYQLQIGMYDDHHAFACDARKFSNCDGTQGKAEAAVYIDNNDRVVSDAVELPKLRNIYVQGKEHDARTVTPL